QLWLTPSALPHPESRKKTFGLAETTSCRLVAGPVPMFCSEPCATPASPTVTTPNASELGEKRKSGAVGAPPAPPPPAPPVPPPPTPPPPAAPPVPPPVPPPAELPPLPPSESSGQRPEAMQSARAASKSTQLASVSPKVAAPKATERRKNPEEPAIRTSLP